MLLFLKKKLFNWHSKKLWLNSPQWVLIDMRHRSDRTQSGRFCPARRWCRGRRSGPRRPSTGKRSGRHRTLAGRTLFKKISFKTSNVKTDKHYVVVHICWERGTGCRWFGYTTFFKLLKLMLKKPSATLNFFCSDYFSSFHKIDFYGALEISWQNIRVLRNRVFGTTCWHRDFWTKICNRIL